MMRASLHSLFKRDACIRLHHHTTIQIDISQLKDAVALAALAKKTYAETYHGSIFTPELFDFKFGANYANNILPAEFRDQDILYLVYRDGKKLAGYAKINFKDGAYLEKLYLLKQYHGRGLGRKLLLRCFEEALRREKSAMTLSAFEFNRRAITFYESYGFRQQGEHQLHVHVMTGLPTAEHYIDMRCDNMAAQLQSSPRLRVI